MDDMTENLDKGSNKENFESELIEDIVEEIIEEEGIHKNPSEVLLISDKYDSSNPNSDIDKD